MKPAATIAFREDKFDQWRAEQVGALIGFNRRGVAEYQFKTWEQYQRFLALNSRRQEYEEGSFERV